MLKKIHFLFITIASLLTLPALYAQEQQTAIEQKQPSTLISQELQKNSNTAIANNNPQALLQEELKVFRDAFTKLQPKTTSLGVRSTASIINLISFVMLGGLPIFLLEMLFIASTTDPFSLVSGSALTIISLFFVVIFNFTYLALANTALSSGGILSELDQYSDMQKKSFSSPLLLTLKNLLNIQQQSLEKKGEEKNQTKIFYQKMFEHIQTILSKQNNAQPTTLWKLIKKYFIWAITIVGIPAIIFLTGILIYFCYMYSGPKTVFVRGHEVGGKSIHGQFKTDPKHWYNYTCLAALPLVVIASVIIHCALPFITDTYLPTFFEKIQPCHQNYLTSLQALVEKIDLSSKETPEPIKKLFGELKSQWLDKNGKLALTNEQASIFFRILYGIAHAHQSFFSQSPAGNLL